MKVSIETVTGVAMNREIDTSDSPMSIIRKFYEEDATAASQIFSNQKAIDQLMEGNVEENRSTFELITVDGDSVRANWKEPLCNQPTIKEELSKLEAEGQMPTFVVSVSSIVASMRNQKISTMVSHGADVSEKNRSYNIVNKGKEERHMFEIREVSTVEATGSIWGAAIGCLGTWASVGLLYAAVCC